MVIPHYFYRYRGVTVNFLPSPRYYREIFSIYHGITAVTAELPLSPLPCHSLLPYNYVICATLVLWSCSKCCLTGLSDLLIFLLTFFSSGIKSENFLTLLFRHVLLRVLNVDWIFKLIELYVCVCVWFSPVFIVVD